ncbi:Zn-dependent amino- or carboxypeptidase, M28 family [Granulicella rosea]|uniref:Zn-dependent amino- or carboxypeptidase, M28 family n=1 Tax=Granulicella rosea TaxID=474952 RepID=A0A239LGC9_9BACT|nr:M28 family peptidase [Granulicella rosea]SNT29531.1 Zn-dependent amino- or carboxypeptidase, M28 family [Granulicella rosea]
MQTRALALVLAVASLSTANAQKHTRDAEIHDPDTLAWWHTTEALSNDKMEGRDTGSAAYLRAADYVVKRFKAAGLQPAGEAGTYLQTVPMHEVAVDPAIASFTILPGLKDVKGAPATPENKPVPLAFLQEITVTATPDLYPLTIAPMTFRGYCGKDAMKEIAGKIVVCFGTQRTGLPTAAERAANARAGGAQGIVNVDDPYFTIEPPRWPAAYARSVGVGPAPAKGALGSSMLVMKLSSTSFGKLLAGTGHDPEDLLAEGGAKQPLASFDIPARLQVRMRVTQRTYSSPNIIAALPGSDPALKDEYVVIAAHLDGYGYGTPVLGDKLYNGALDDAAYVAFLIQFADNLKKEQRPLKRSILFCVFTGEEKGLLGSNWFVDHPTVPIAKLAADINLDQLRPLFPLKLLTASAIDDTTLGVTARAVGGSMGIALQPDKEPERGLLRRADNYPFLRVGVPAISFIFGYEPGTEDEKRYREWYQVRYHRPQDDLTQPVDFEAAAKLNQFLYTLTEAVANKVERPAFVPGSKLAPKIQQER